MTRVGARIDALADLLFLHWGVALLVQLLAIVALALAGPLLGAPLFVATTALAVMHALPGPARAAIVALGWWRVAIVQAHLDWTATSRDRWGVALLAVAACRLRRPDDAAIAAWLERALDRIAVVGPGAVVAAGIQSFVAGDRADARRLWRLAVEFDDRVAPPWVVGWAADLLAAEAASVGEQARLSRELARPRVPATRFTALIGALCDRARGVPISDGRLRWLWLAAGPNRSTLDLIARIPAPPARDPVAAPLALPNAEPNADPLTRAIAGLLTLDPRPTRQQVASAADAWSEALASGATTAQIRSLAGAAADPVGEVRTRVVEALAAHLDAVDAPADPDEAGSDLFFEAVWRAADRRDAELGWLSEEIGHRTDARRALPLMEEVRAFCALIEAYERIVALAPDRASASFPRLYYPIVRHTVWLHNKRGQTRLANAMYRVELRFAERCAHDSGTALLTKNLACGPL